MKHKKSFILLFIGLISASVGSLGYFLYDPSGSDSLRASVLLATEWGSISLCAFIECGFAFFTGKTLFERIMNSKS